MPYTVDSNLKEIPSIDLPKLHRFLFSKQATRLGKLVMPILEIGNLYGINPIYILAHAILESNWGQSKIAEDKNNLFGYGAIDSDPYNSAYAFPNRECGVLYVMWKIRKNYLTEEGKYWGGSATLEGMNKRYASDKKWAEKICNIMNLLTEG